MVKKEEKPAYYPIETKEDMIFMIKIYFPIIFGSWILLTLLSMGILYLLILFMQGLELVGVL